MAAFPAEVRPSRRTRQLRPPSAAAIGSTRSRRHHCARASVPVAPADAIVGRRLDFRLSEFSASAAPVLRPLPDSRLGGEPDVNDGWSRPATGAVVAKPKSAIRADRAKQSARVRHDRAVGRFRHADDRRQMRCRRAGAAMALARSMGWRCHEAGWRSSSTRRLDGGRRRGSSSRPRTRLLAPTRRRWGG
jgi:hypothetical protein